MHLLHFCANEKKKSSSTKISMCDYTYILFYIRKLYFISRLETHRFYNFILSFKKSKPAFHLTGNQD